LLVALERNGKEQGERATSEPANFLISLQSISTSSLSLSPARSLARSFACSFVRSLGLSLSPPPTGVSMCSRVSLFHMLVTSKFYEALVCRRAYGVPLLPLDWRGLQSWDGPGYGRSNQQTLIKVYSEFDQLCAANWQPSPLFA